MTARDDFGAVPVVAGPRRSGPDRPARGETLTTAAVVAAHLVTVTVPAGADGTPTVDQPFEVRGGDSLTCVIGSVLGYPTFHCLGRPDLPHREFMLWRGEVWAHDELLDALPAEVESLRDLGSAHQVMHDGYHSHDASGHLTSGQVWTRISHVTRRVTVSRDVHGYPERKSASAFGAYDPHRHRLYQLTCEDYDALLARCERRCEVCRVAETDGRWGRLCIDHDHRYGRWAVRGLLCSRCNITIEGAQDSPEVARYLSGAWYLETATRRGIPLIENPPEPPVGSVIRAPGFRAWVRTDEDYYRLNPRRHSRTIRSTSWQRIVHEFGYHNLDIDTPCGSGDA